LSLQGITTTLPGGDCKGYLAACNGSEKDLAGSCLSVEEIHELAQCSGARRVAVICDACFSHTVKAKDVHGSKALQAAAKLDVKNVGVKDGRSMQMMVAGSAEDLALKRGLGCGTSILDALGTAFEEKLFDRNLTADMSMLVSIVRNELQHSL
jgi:TPP-dependent pyruvate/acetoin dehydrogenase alpha subunit